VLLLVALVAPRVPPVELIRLVTFDTYQALAPRTRASEPVVIVAVDDASVARQGQWPWPRSVLARLVVHIAASTPAAIGVDIVMSEPDRLSPGRLPALVPGLESDVIERLERLPSHERLLADALGRVPSVLGAAGLDDADLATVKVSGGWTPMHLVGRDPRPFVRRFVAALGSLEEVDRAGRGRGLLNADREAGVVRRVPMLATVGEILAPGLAPEVLRVAAGHPTIAVETSADGVRAVGVAGVRVPTERDGRLRIHYSRHDRGRFVSAADVLAGAVPAERFARKVVLLGVTAVGLTDYTATPVSDRMSGVEIQAQAIENIFDRDFLVRPGWAPWAEGAALALLGGSIVLLIPVLQPRQSLALFFVSVGLAWGTGVLLYVYTRVLLDALSPTLALGVLFGVMVSITLAETQAQRRALRGQLAQEREAATRLAGEMEAARRIQTGLLPRPDALRGHGTVFELAPHLQPAITVGGDLYDFFETSPDRLFFSLGDVAGKGLRGCLFMAVSKSHCKSAALRRKDDVGAILTEANSEVSRENPESLFVTLFAGILALDTGVLDHCSAGHDAPYLLRPGKPPSRLPAVGGFPLCVVEDFTYEGARFQLVAGDMLCLVTDGVTEATNAAGELYGRARLEGVLRRGAGSPAALVESLRADVATFVGGGEPTDDVAILVLRWNGPRARA
jgi:CHASE2 domain-containing sensor protein